MSPKNRKISDAASAMGKRSAEVRLKKWGKQEFLRRMRAYGAMGGRPKGNGKKEGGKG
jgi:hypothetical protein